MQSKSIVLIGMFCLVTAGCYTRAALTTPVPAPATRIVATLTDSGTVAMGNQLGAGALEVEGVVANADANAWQLLMVRVDHRDGRSISWNREPVRFSPRSLTNAQIVKLDKKRSWLAAGGITIGAFILASTFDLLGASEEDKEGEEPQAAWVLPIRR